MLVQAACSPQPDCEAYYVATFISQSVPTTMVAGQSYAVSIQMENDGSRTWSAANGDSLNSQNPMDNMTWGMNRVDVPGSVAELDIAIFNFTVQAPSTPGTYNFQWRMHHGAVWFGDWTPNVVVTVTGGTNNPPTVTLTAPANGASAVAPASFTLTANASDSDGTISKVEFKSNGVLLGTDTSAPYSWTYSNVAAGTYAITAVATDNSGTAATSNTATVTVTSTPPTVTLTAPANGASAVAPASFTLTANASDSDGTISKVEFKSNGVLLGTDTSAPYSWTYSNVAAGTYAITAVATDNSGTAATSNTATVTVTSTPPTVTLTAPANGASAVAPASFTLTANASDSDGTISKVEFKSNGVLLGTDTSAPYSWTYSNVAAGTYAITAVATDNSGTAATSNTATVTVTSTPPTVTLTAPANGASAVAPASFTLTANASDSDGTISKVEFKSNGVLLGTDTSAPYSWTYSNVAAGTYAITAVATDNSGTAATSGTATVTVTPGTVSLTRSYKYDANERLCKSIDPEVGATIIDYDLASNVAWTAPSATLIDPNQCSRMSVPSADKTLRSYDAMNRVTAVATPGGTADLTYTYAPDGLVTQVTANNPGNATVTTTYAYYKRRLLQQEIVSQPSASFTLGYSYTGNGHLSTLTYPDNQIVAYAPNALGQPTQVGSYAKSVTYYPNGAIKQFSYGNDVVHTMTQNTRLLPARSRDAGATVVLDDSYDFDANGNVTDITDQAQAGLTTRGMAYDGLDRLTIAVAPNLWGNATYGYDALDNLRSADQGTRQYRYVYDAQLRLSQINNPAGTPQITLSYDARGNITSKNSQAFVFDTSNRLNQVTGQETYRYDGQGRRVQATMPDTKSMFWQYSQAGQVMYVSDTRRSRNTAYLYLGNTMVAMRHEAWGTGTVTVSYQHTDALGSPVAETDAGGLVTKRNTYAPYGEAYNSSIDGPGYTGHVMDQATGLTYMQQRYYDPQVGRFLSVDPAVSDLNSGANFNRYWYANNNPYKFTDPDGRYAAIDDAIFAGTGAVVGLIGQGVSDVISGSASPWQDYVAAAVGGAVGGEAALYTIASGPGAIIAAGAASGAATNLTKQALHKATDTPNATLDLNSLVSDAAIGAAVARVPGAKIAGVNAGKGSMLSVTKQLVTKLRGGQIDSVSAKSAVKMTKAITAEASGATTAAAVIGGVRARLPPPPPPPPPPDPKCVVSRNC